MHDVAAGRARRIERDVVRDAVLVVVAGVPVVDPLPDIARHVGQAKGVGTVARLVGGVGCGPVEVGLAAQRAVIKPDGCGVRKVSVLPGIAGTLPVRESTVGIGVVAPGELVVGVGLAAARGVFPFGFGRQAVAVLRQITGAAGEVVARRVAVTRTQPIGEGRGAKPAHTSDRVLLPPGAHGERVAGVADGGQRDRRGGVEKDVAAAKGVDDAGAHLDQSTFEGRVQVAGVFAVGDQRGGHVERRDRDAMQRDLVTRMIRVHKAEVVAHHVAAARNADEHRREGGHGRRGSRHSDADRRCSTAELAVVDDQAGHISPRNIRCEAGLGRRAGGQSGHAARRYAAQGPCVAQCIAVRIRAGAAVQADQRVDDDGLGGAGIGDGCRVADGYNRHIRVATAATTAATGGKKQTNKQGRKVEVFHVESTRVLQWNR